MQGTCSCFYTSKSNSNLVHFISMHILEHKNICQFCSRLNLRTDFVVFYTYDKKKIVTYPYEVIAELNYDIIFCKIIKRNEKDGS